MTNEEYGSFVKTKTPPSGSVKNSIRAFISGGTICAAGQVLLDIFMRLGMSFVDAATMLTVTMIFIGSLLTGLGIYPKIAKYAGAGTLVPVTGFANSVTAPALEARIEGIVPGIGSKICTIAGPVILYGALVSVFCAIVLLSLL